MRGRQTPANQPCDITAILERCGIPLPCAVGQWQDTGSANGFMGGSLQFGRALSGNVIDEAHLVDYRLDLTDSCNRTIGDAIAVVNKTHQDVSCCRTDTYRFVVNYAPVPVEPG